MNGNSTLTFYTDEIQEIWTQEKCILDYFPQDQTLLHCWEDNHGLGLSRYVTT
jgi:hypothetical protein